MADKTTTGRLISAAGGIVLIISLFLSWYGFSIGGPAGSFAGGVADSLNIDTTINGWQSLDIGDIVLLLIGLLAILPAALDVLDRQLDLPFDLSMAVFGAGIVAVVWVLWRIIDKPGGDTQGIVDTGVKFGIFVALIGAALVTLGGLKQRYDSELVPAVPNAGVPPDSAQPASASAAGSAPPAPPAAAAPPAQPQAPPAPSPTPPAPPAPPAQVPPPEQQQPPEQQPPTQPPAL